jgi:formylmethanofuran dehydrogenase subunit E
MTQENDFKIEPRWNEKTGNMEFTVKGTMPAIEYCSKCKEQIVGTHWRAGGVLLCTGCVTEPPS